MFKVSLNIFCLDLDGFIFLYFPLALKCLYFSTDVKDIFIVDIVLVEELFTSKAWNISFYTFLTFRFLSHVILIRFLLWVSIFPYSVYLFIFLTSWLQRVMERSLRSCLFGDFGFLCLDVHFSPYSHIFPCWSFLSVFSTYLVLRFVPSVCSTNFNWSW